MEELINPRSVARLATAATLVLSLAPVSAAASAPAAAHRLKYDLCDGHKWSLFGCRADPGRHGIGRPDGEGPRSADD